jgi:elongation factor Ts
LQIANLNPQYVRREDVPEAVIEAERDHQRDRALKEGKPEAIVEKIIEGRMGKFYEKIVLFEQAFIKDDGTTIGELVTQAIAELGENITINRFVRFAIGEGDGQSDNS